MARPDKAAAVAEITDRFRESEAAILTEYRGLRVSELAEVRDALRGADAEYKVLKNTLARIAAREVGIEDFDELLTGPTAIVFVKDDVAAAAKALDDIAKNHPVLVVKGGVMQGRIFDADQAKALARLEPRDVQLSKIAMMMNQPAQLTMNVLAALLRDFGSMLAQVVDKKGSDEPPSGDGAPQAETPPDAAPGTPAEVPGEPEPTQDDAPEEPASTPEAEEQAEAAPESQEAADEDVTTSEAGNGKKNEEA